MHDQVNVGDVVTVSGPFGKFSFTGKDAPEVVLIAGGVGITPVMSIMRYLTDKAWPGAIHFLFVAKTEDDLIFHDEINWLRRRFPRLNICVTLTRIAPESKWTGDRGRPTESLLRGFVPHLHQLPIYLCGPNEMMDATRDLLTTMGVPTSNVLTEAFASKKPSLNGEVERSPANEIGLVIEPPESPALASSATTKAKVHFSRSDIHTDADFDTTILEAAEAASIELPYECRSGICGQCKTRLVEGTVRMDSEDALSPSEKSAGLILTCQAHPLTNVVVEA